MLEREEIFTEEELGGGGAGWRRSGLVDCVLEVRASDTRARQSALITYSTWFCRQKYDIQEQKGTREDLSQCLGTNFSRLGRGALVYKGTGDDVCERNERYL